MTKRIPPEALSVIHPKQVEALNILSSTRVPDSALKSRPGKGGKKFTYVEHVWVTRLLQNGFQTMWNFEVLDWQVYEDVLEISGKPKEKVRTVAARCQLTLRYLINPEQRKFDSDPYFYEQVVTEVGIFEPNRGMTTAAAIASAVSRGLCRCTARATGVGLEFYGSPEEDLTPERCWAELKKFARNSGANWNKEFENEFLERIKAAGISDPKTQLVDEYYKAYHVLAVMLGKVLEVVEIPDASGTED